MLFASREMKSVHVGNWLLHTHSQNICTEIIAPMSEDSVSSFFQLPFSHTAEDTGSQQNALL